MVDAVELARMAGRQSPPPEPRSLKFRNLTGMSALTMNTPMAVPCAQPRAPKWLRRYLGDDYFRAVSRVISVDQPLSHATLAPLTDLSVIEELRFLTRMRHRKAPVDPPPGL